MFDLRVERVRVALVGDAQARPGVEASLRALTSRGAPDQRLAQRFGLSREVLDFIWTCLAIQADPRLWPLAHKACSHDIRRGTTLACHAQLFGLDGVVARNLALELAPGHPAARARVVVPAQEGIVHPATPFSVPERIWGYLLGMDGIDPALRQAGGPLAPPPGGEAEPRLVRVLEQNDPVLVVVEGPDGVGRRAAAARAAAAVGRDLVELDLERWDARTSLEALVAVWWRECVLRDALGLVAHLDALVDPAERRRLCGLIDQLPGVILATSRPGGADLRFRRPILRVSMAAPDAAASHKLWRRVLAETGTQADVDLLARRYRLGEAGMRRAVEVAHLLGDEGDVDVVAGARAGINERLGELAMRVTPTQGWDDLILPEDTLDQVRGLVARVKHAHRVLDGWGFGKKVARGQGVAALLSGPPGTGKTMVAGLIARELELELYLVDLSRVVSKWVGETEKQLASLFDAAESGHALLLFDEADSLFAKRTEVKGASDRYANLEVNYLLQRIEAFSGVALLTTNVETGIDPAVRRRLAAHIVFWPPDEEERSRLWWSMVPAEAPIQGQLDFRALAKAFPSMTGAHIRNAAVAAAFLAAAENCKLGQGQLERAARAEYKAMGRVLAGPPGGGK